MTVGGHLPLTRDPLRTGHVDTSDVPGRVVPPPIPGTRTTHFTYFNQTRSYPLARAPLAAGRDEPDQPGGGVLLAPDQASGVMRIYGWWPDATSLQVIRRDPDGLTRFVRGAAPRRVTGRTRRNLVLNPSGEGPDGLGAANGYLPWSGQPAIDVAARADEPRDGTHAVRMVVGPTASDRIRVPTESAAATDDRFTIGVEVFLPARPTLLAISQSWLDDDGNEFGAQTYQFTVDDITSSTGQFWRHRIELPVPGGAAMSGNLTVRADGPEGLEVHLDRWTAEFGSTDGSYCAGSTPGGQWLGTPELSPSLNAPVQEIVDAECPFDSNVVYDVYAGARVGWVRSPSAVLPARRSHYNWAISHPARPGRTLFVWVEADPDITNDLARSKLKVQGRKNAVVLTGPERGGDEGSLTFITDGQAELDALRRELRSGAPLQVRTPAHHGHPPVWWLSFASTSVGGLTHWAGQPVRKLTAPFDEVDPPSVIDWGALA